MMAGHEGMYSSTNTPIMRRKEYASTPPSIAFVVHLIGQDAQALGIEGMCQIRGHADGLELTSSSGQRLIACVSAEITGFGVQQNVVCFALRRRKQDLRFGLVAAQQHVKDLVTYFRRTTAAQQ